jgi:hypothetical protein
VSQRIAGALTEITRKGKASKPTEFDKVVNIQEV